VLDCVLFYHVAEVFEDWLMDQLVLVVVAQGAAVEMYARISQAD
jgi:hypothetical protein